MRSKLETKSWDSWVVLCLSDRFESSSQNFSFAPSQRKSRVTRRALRPCAGLCDPGSCRPSACRVPKLLPECRSQQKRSQVAGRVNVMEIAPRDVTSSVIFCPQDINFALCFSEACEILTHSLTFLKLERGIGFWF